MLFPQELVDYIENKMIGRLATPEEIANLCIYLASDEVSQLITCCGFSSYSAKHFTNIM